MNLCLNFSYIFYFAEHLPVNYKQIAADTKKDTILSKVYYCLFGWPKNISISNELKPFFFRKQELHLEQGCLLRGYRVIIPTNLRKYFLNELHSSHLGISKCKSLARSFFWWPKLDNDIELLCNNCSTCTIFRVNPVISQLHPWPITTVRCLGLDYT